MPFCPGFIFEITATRSVRPDRRGLRKPHICCYSPHNLKAVRTSDKSSRTDFGYAELFIEVCPSPSDDFFTDPPPDADPSSRSSHEFRARSSSPEERVQKYDNFGQHVAYVVEIFARQHRAFLFTIAMSGSLARLFRWDRAGCVVSEAFDIRVHPDILYEFLWRFSRTSYAGRGHDLSVQRALPTEETLFRDAITEYVRSQIEPAENLEKAVHQHYAKEHVYVAEILHQDFTALQENTRRFIFSRPVVSPLSLVSRGTRGYWAVDASTGKVVFLKDSWRDASSEEVEGATLRRLLDVGVRYVPSLVWHGDVPRHYPDSSRKLSKDSHIFVPVQY